MFPVHNPSVYFPTQPNAPMSLPTSGSPTSSDGYTPCPRPKVYMSFPFRRPRSIWPKFCHVSRVPVWLTGSAKGIVLDTLALIHITSRCHIRDRSPILFPLLSMSLPKFQYRFENLLKCQSLCLFPNQYPYHRSQTPTGLSRPTRFIDNSVSQSNLFNQQVFSPILNQLINQPTLIQQPHPIIVPPPIILPPPIIQHLHFHPLPIFILPLPVLIPLVFICIRTIHIWVDIWAKSISILGHKHGPLKQ